MSYQEQRVPSHLSPHHPMFQSQYRQPMNQQAQQSQPRQPPMRAMARPMTQGQAMQRMGAPQQRHQQQHPSGLQYRPRNVPQMQYNREQPPVEARPYTQQQRPQHSQQYPQRQYQMPRSTAQRMPQAPQYQQRAPPIAQQRMPGIMPQATRSGSSQSSGNQSGNYDGLPMRPGSEGQYILYHSNYCVNSKEFMNILCKTPYYQKFTKINITAPNSPRPGFLKYTPTIVVPGVDRPLEGDEVFSWLETQAEQKAKKEPVGIQPYQPMEMGSSMTDSYSYLDVDPAAQPMEHSFSFIGKPLEKINTPKEEEFADTNLKAVRGEVNMSNRPPLPQAMQQSQGMPHVPPGMAKPSIPQSSGNRGEDKESLDKAYQDLLNRRKMDAIPPPRQG